MDKIFMPDVEQYLLDCGVTEEQIKKIKFDVIKKETITILQKVTDLISQNKFEKVKDMLAHSPAGDDMGCDNYFIDFRDIFSKDYADLNDVCHILMELDPEKGL